jgi:hypothetical protein
VTNNKIAPIQRLTQAGEQAGFTIEEMIHLLEAGLPVESLIDVIGARLNCTEASLTNSGTHGYLV